MTSIKRNGWIRLSVQILFFALIALGTVSHGLAELGVEVPFLEGASIHALCPLGGVVTLWQLATTGRLVKQVHESSLVLLGLTLVLALVFGPVFCGWACPFGSFQEWLGKLGKAIFKKRYNTFVPKKLDRALRYLRYIILAWVLIMTARTGILMFQNVDPYNALFNAWTGTVALPGLVALGLVMLASMFVERPFCKYACPMGAVLGVTNLFRPLGIKRVQKTCISCKACDRACPMNIEVSTSGRVRDHQCISCGECSSERACPVPATVTWSLPGSPRGNEGDKA